MKVEIIAEIGSNHDGSLGQAMALAQAAVQAGADTVKFQDHMGQGIPIHGEHPPWMNHGCDQPVESRCNYVLRTMFNDEREWLALSHFVRRSCGRRFMVSPFSVDALRFHLERKTLDAIKIASGQVTNRPLLELARDSGLPVHLSMGMATTDEVDAASDWLDEADVTWMHCTSEYPCRPESVNLHMMFRCAKRGLSDHTLGMAASLAAITLGATVIERHVGWSRQAYGSDAGHSLTMEEFAAFVREVRDLEKMLSSTVSKDEMAKRLEKTRVQFLYREAK